MTNSISSIYSKKEQIYTTTTPVNFRSSTPATLERTPDADTVSVNQQNKKTSKGAKWAIGIGGTIAALAAAGICLAKHDSRKIAKLCKDKIVLSTLPEHIEFKEAKTLEEGLKYAKEILGIKQIEGDFSLDAINFVNKGITDVSNAYKGHLYIPSSIKYAAQKDGILASANLGLKTDKYGQLTVNKKYFDNEYLDKVLSDYLGLTPKASPANGSATKADEKLISEYFGIDWSPRFKELAKKFQDSASNLSIIEKRELLSAYRETSKLWSNYTNYNPTKILKIFKEPIEKRGIKFDIDNISKLPLEQQKEQVYQILKEFEQKTGGILGLRSKEASTYSTIYHEMGHLQDYAKNLERLTQQNSDWERMKQIWQSKGPIDIGTEDVEFVANRWNKISDGNLRKILKENPEKLKKLLPDLYEHVTNEEIQKIAGEVSDYATQGVGEYVAEVHAGLIDGKKFSKKVMDLYEKYNGPMPVTA